MRFPLFVLHSPDIKLLWGKLRNVSLNETSDPLWFMETDGLNMFHLFDLFSLFSSRACAFNTTFCLNNGVSSQSSQNFEGFFGGGVKNSTEVLFFWTNLMVTSDGFGWLLALQERQSVCCSACVITDKRACQRESQRAHTRPHAHAVTILLTWQASHVHFLQVFGLQDDHGQLASGGHVSQGEADIAQLLLLLGDIT